MGASPVIISTITIFRTDVRHTTINSDFRSGIGELTFRLVFELVEVTRGCLNGTKVKRLDASGFYGNHAVGILEHSLDQKESLADDLEPILLEHLRRDDDVGDACLVLHA